MAFAQGAANQPGEPVAGREARCQLWGVLNVTPDSFSDGGRFLDRAAALDRGRQMLADGADVIDVGGASSRPQGASYGAGAAAVAAPEEAERAIPVVHALTRELAAVVSIDTTQVEVARAAIEAGATIVNDVSCGQSSELLELAARSGVQYVLMHTRGQGQVAAPFTDYADVVAEVVRELLSAVERAEQAGIARSRLWIDPGLGFAKTSAQSLALLSGTAALVRTGLRVLCGPSRKAFIAEVARLPNGERPVPVEREAGTAAAVTVAVLQGAHAVRVHDVAGCRQAVRVAEALRACGGAPC